MDQEEDGPNRPVGFSQIHNDPYQYLPNLAALVACSVTWLWRVLFRDDAGLVTLVVRDGSDGNSGPSESESDQSRMCRIAHARHPQAPAPLALAIAS